MIPCPLKCDPVSGALLVISHRVALPPWISVKHARIPVSDPLPSVDPFSIPPDNREFVKRSPPPLPSVDLSEKPLKIDDTPDYRMLAQQQLDANLTSEYPNVATFAFLAELPPEPDPTDPPEWPLPSVVLGEAPPARPIHQHVAKSSPTRRIGYVR
jgi:hypothetical protein